MRLVTIAIVCLTISILADAAIRAVSADDDRAAVIADQESGIVRVTIDGREVARFTNADLQVRDSIEYGGTITDSGTANFDQQIGARGAP